MKVTRKLSVLALIAFAMLMSQAPFVSAQEEAVSAEKQEVTQKTEEELAAIQASKEEKRKAAIQKKRVMESCLTLTRAFYSSQEQMVKEFLDNHPTKDKQRLLSKILSQMMIHCNSSINQPMIDELQQYKNNPNDFDYKKTGYQELIDIDWEELTYRQTGENPVEGEGSGPVPMTQQEIFMSNDVEEYSDELKRESEVELRSTMGKISIAFIDIENMSMMAKVTLFAIVMATFAFIGGYFYKNLSGDQRDINVQRKEQIRARKEKKQ